MVCSAFHPFCEQMMMTIGAAAESTMDRKVHLPRLPAYAVPLSTGAKLLIMIMTRGGLNQVRSYLIQKRPLLRQGAFKWQICSIIS